jgi:hypothetical protein
MVSPAFPVPGIEHPELGDRDHRRMQVPLTLRVDGGVTLRDREQVGDALRPWRDVGRLFGDTGR